MAQYMKVSGKTISHLGSGKDYTKEDRFTKANLKIGSAMDSARIPIRTDSTLVNGKRMLGREKVPVHIKLEDHTLETGLITNFMALVP